MIFIFVTGFLVCLLVRAKISSTNLVDNITFKAYYPTIEYERKIFRIIIFELKDYIMNTIDYFKLQAKNLHRDFKTKTPVSDKTISAFLFEYKPKYFDIEMIISDFDIDEENFSLMNAQYVIAKIANFESWAMLLKAPSAELELAKLLYDNQNKIDLIGWQFYINDAQSMSEIELEAEIQVDIFKQVVVEENIFDDVEIESYLLKHYD